GAKSTIPVLSETEMRTRVMRRSWSAMAREAIAQPRRSVPRHGLAHYGHPRLCRRACGDRRKSGASRSKFSALQWQLRLRTARAARTHVGAGVGRKGEAPLHPHDLARTAVNDDLRGAAGALRRGPGHTLLRLPAAPASPAS